MSRKDSYEERIKESLKLIESMVESGSTDKEIAEKIEVSYATYRKYKANSVALQNVIATAKSKRQQNTEKALYKACIGYHYYEEVATKCKTEIRNADGSITVDEDIKVTSVKKYKPADLNAIKYYLNNKASTQWKDDPHKVKNDKKLTKLKEKELEMKEL